MTQKEFDKAINRLARRMQLMREAQSGSVKLRAISIPKCTVPEHIRGAHTRHIAPAGWKHRKSS